MSYESTHEQDNALPSRADLVTRTVELPYPIEELILTVLANYANLPRTNWIFRKHRRGYVTESIRNAHDTFLFLMTVPYVLQLSAKAFEFRNIRASIGDLP